MSVYAAGVQLVSLDAENRFFKVQVMFVHVLQTSNDDYDFRVWHGYYKPVVLYIQDQAGTSCAGTDANKAVCGSEQQLSRQCARKASLERPLQVDSCSS